MHGWQIPWGLRLQAEGLEEGCIYINNVLIIRNKSGNSLTFWILPKFFFFLKKKPSLLGGVEFLCFKCLMDESGFPRFEPVSKSSEVFKICPLRLQLCAVFYLIKSQALHCVKCNGTLNSELCRAALGLLPTHLLAASVAEKPRAVLKSAEGYDLKRSGLALLMFLL